MANPNTIVNVALPTSLREWVNRQVKARNYSNSGEFIRHLLRAARADQEELEAALLEGLNGKRTTMTPAKWDQLREECRERAAAARNKPARSRGGTKRRAA